MVTAIVKHPVPDWVKPSFVIFDIQALSDCQSAQMSKITNDSFNLVWHRTLYNCTHMATVGVKGILRNQTHQHIVNC